MTQGLGDIIQPATGMSLDVFGMANDENTSFAPEQHSPHTTVPETVLDLLMDPMFSVEGTTIDDGSSSSLEPTTFNTAAFDVAWQPEAELLPSAEIEGCQGAEASLFGAKIVGIVRPRRASI